MRIVRFRDAQGERLGLLIEQQGRLLIADVAHKEGNFPSSVSDWLAQLDHLRPKLEAALPGAAKIAFGSVEVLAPLPAPQNFFAAGLNYKSHALEMGIEIPRVPRVFSKLTGTVNSPFGAVRHPGFSDSLDYEGELAVVVGRRCRDVSPEEARDCIAGYLIVNDLSLRALVNEDSLVLGKGCDGFAPQGPWITTADEIGEVAGLRIRTWVNDELRQDCMAGDMIHSPDMLLARCSRGITLQVGDIISTGSPPGSGHGMNPRRYLQRDDKVRVAIEGLGAIESAII